MPHADTVEELPVKDTRTKKYRLKVIPKLPKTAYFQAVFVFEGDKAPSMSVVSYSKGVSIEDYQVWKDIVKELSRFIIIMALLEVLIIAVLSLIVHFTGIRRYRKSIERFVQHAAELRKQGELKSDDEQVISDARTIYASFIRPKPSKVWSKIFGAQRLDD